MPFRRLLSLFENSVGLNRPLWRDWSKHNSYVDHAISKANGVRGMFARAAISWGYKDPLFAHNWIGAGIAGIHRSSYHVLYAGQPVEAQADNWYAVHDEIDVIPRVIDLEVDMGVHPEQYASTTWNMSCLVLERDGVRPIIYSRYMLIDLWLRFWTPEMLNEHYWFLAQYLRIRSNEHPGPPTPPARVQPDRILWHQTADKKAGFPGECKNSAADYSRWERGNLAEMYAFIKETWGGDDPPDEPPDEPPGCSGVLDNIIAFIEKQRSEL